MLVQMLVLILVHVSTDASTNACTDDEPQKIFIPSKENRFMFDNYYFYYLFF